MTVTATNKEGVNRTYQTRWQTTALGYPGRLASVPAGIVRTGSVTGSLNRVEIDRPGMIEWFENRPSGLEQGWTILDRPHGDEGVASLVLELSLEGDLSAQVSEDGQEVILLDAAANEALRYNKLKAWDAKGNILATRMSGGGNRLVLEIEDAEASYPLTVDPIFSQQAYLKASNTNSGDSFGVRVAISGDTAVVGAPGEDSHATGINGDQSSNSSEGSGAVYVFTRAGNGWVQQAYLKASNTDAGDQFGSSVDIDGDTLVVGAPEEKGTANGVNGNQSSNHQLFNGAAYVFRRNGEVWTQEAYLKDGVDPTDETGGSFGTDVGVSGNTVVVGAPNDDGSGVAAGGAYVFIRNNLGEWSSQAYLKASNAEEPDDFGYSVAIDGDLIAVGAPDEQSTATGINGNEDDNSSSYVGAVYVFGRVSSNWSQLAYLKSDFSHPWENFGYDVSVSGESVAVGGGSWVHVFTRAETTWSREARIERSGPNSGDAFGESVALSGDILVVGAHDDNSASTGVNGDKRNEGADRSGAAHVFVRSGSVWRNFNYLKASNTDGYDRFGRSVAVSGETVLVGAPDEASGSTGVNGNQRNNGAPYSGAAYVFQLGPAPARPVFTGLKRFPVTFVGGRSRPQVVRVVNAGDFSLTDLRLSVSGKARGDFSLSQPAAKRLAPGAATKFRIWFSPRSGGKRVAELVARGNFPAVHQAISGAAKEK